MSFSRASRLAISSVYVMYYIHHSGKCVLFRWDESAGKRTFVANLLVWTAAICCPLKHSLHIRSRLPQFDPIRLKHLFLIQNLENSKFHSQLSHGKMCWGLLTVGSVKFTFLGPSEFSLDCVNNTAKLKVLKRNLEKVIWKKIMLSFASGNSIHDKLGRN